MSNVKSIIPGLLFSAGIATIAYYLAKLPFVKDTLHVGALLIVILFGMAWRTFLPIHGSLKPGIALAQKPLLRWAVAGLGFKLSLDELLKVGGPGLVVVTICTVAAFFFARWICAKLGVPEKLGTLIGFGGAICGASAIVAADSVVQSDKSETACALGTITLLGTIGIIVYPFVGRAIGMSDFAFGVWNGASLHEMAQVVAAGDAYSSDAAGWSTVVKLARITLLAPLVFFLLWELKRRPGAENSDAKVQTVPWFLVAFVVFVAINSLPAFPADLRKLLQDADLWLLCVGMAGVGLQSGFQDVKAAGWMPVLAGLLQWIFLAAISLALALLIPAPAL